MNTETKIPCGCGRSETGYCVGLHKMTNEQYSSWLKTQQKQLDEQTKPQLLND